MNVITTDIEGLLILEPKIFRDQRGYFIETWSERDFNKLIGRDVRFVQDNESQSSYGVVRGLHFQQGEHWQAKLVRVLEGKVLDVAVDLRPESPTFGKYVAVELSGENKRQLFMPRGFAHGFSVLSPTATFAYKCDNYYCPESEDAIAWNDPDIAIDWRIQAGEVILSEKDSRHQSLKDYIKKNKL